MPGCVVCRFNDLNLDGVARRLALTHRIGRYLGRCPPIEAEEFASRLILPSGSVAVRVKRVHISLPGIDTYRLEKKIAGKVALGRKVDLEKPDVELRILASGSLHFFITSKEIDRRQFDRRKVALRPFFSPISLHPRYARALVNLTRVKRGQTLLDPFCGTGGILMEAATIGVRTYGSDVSKDMVAGCANNLHHFGLDYEGMEKIDIGGIAAAFGEVDVVATDPPYGRSTSTMNEPIKELYARAFHSMGRVLKGGGSLAIVLPTPCPGSLPSLDLRENHEQRVHRSLTRTYCIFMKR